MTTVAAQKTAARKARNEKINFGFKEDGDDGLVGIPRFKLTPKHVNNVFECEVEYVVDEQGMVVYPERFMWECMPPPFKYTVVPKQPVILPPDDAVDPYYIGETRVVAWNVPLSVDGPALRAFIEKGLERTDDGFISLEAEIKEVNEKLTRCNERLDNVPFMSVDAQSEKGEAEERKQIGKRLELEKTQLTEELDKLEAELDEQNKNKKGNGSMQLEQWSTDEKRKLSNWYVDFARRDDAQRCVSFEEWTGVTLALGFKDKKTSVPPEAFWGEVETERIEDEVIMRGIVFQRLRHGQGAYTDWDFGDCYEGGFKHGKRSGRGKVYDRLGFYDGEFADDYRRGRGVQVHASGDRYEGEHGVSQYHLREAKLLGDLFHMGVPHGAGSVHTFADGAVYEGEFQNGEITGRGKYWDPKTGERMEGTFKAGRLHGEGCVHITTTGERLQGTFREGLLHGSGLWESKPRKPRKPPPDELEKFLAGQHQLGDLGGLDAASAPGSVYDPAASREMLLQYKTERAEEELARREQLRLEQEREQAARDAGPAVTAAPRDRSRCVGTFSFGRPHGKCVYEYRKGHTYKGFYASGERSGPGSMVYGNVSKIFDKTTGKTHLKHDFEYQGMWVSDRIRVRGCHITVRDRLLPSEKLVMAQEGKMKGLEAEQRDSYTYTTNFKSWEQYPFLHRIVFKTEARNRKAFATALKLDKKMRKKRLALLAANYKEFREKRREAIRTYKRIDRKLALFDDDDDGDGSGDDDSEEESYYGSDDDYETDETGEEDLEEGDQEGYNDSDWDSLPSGAGGPQDDDQSDRNFGKNHQQFRDLHVTLVDVFENPPPKDEKTGHTSIEKALDHFNYSAQRKQAGEAAY